MADAMYGDVAILKSYPPSVLADVSMHPGIVANALALTDEQVALLTLVDALGGSAPLADCAAVLAGRSRPLDALIGLLEAGLVTVDRAAAFDGTYVVTRVTPART
jgi:hypothetical protein